MPGLRWTACLVLGAAALLIAAGQSPASAEKYCGRMTVQAASGPLHIEIDVLRGRVTCSRARSATRYAWAHKDYSRGNKYLGDPPGWRCAVARATNPAVAGDCVRRRDRALVRAYNVDYGE